MDSDTDLAMTLIWHDNLLYCLFFKAGQQSNYLTEALFL